jgi:hypothetical protein
VHPAEFLLGRLANVPGGARIVISGSPELAQDRLESLRTLRVSRGDPMLDHPTIREESDRHGSSAR